MHSAFARSISQSQISIDVRFCSELGTPVSTSITKKPVICVLSIYRYKAEEFFSLKIAFQLRIFDGVDAKNGGGQMKSDDFRLIFEFVDHLHPTPFRSPLLYELLVQTS